MELLFTGIWRRSLGIETIIVVAMTVIALLVEKQMSYPLFIIFISAYLVIFMGWLKYWHLERVLGIPAAI